MRLRLPHRRRFLGLFSPWLALLVATASAAVVKPDASAARVFAAELQRDFGQRKSAAILPLIDGAAFRQRLFREPNAEEKYPWANWNGVPPALGTVAELDAFPFIAYMRVVLDRDTRILECEFMNAAGGVQSATFFLVQRDDGTVGISDFQWGGDAMPKSQIVRESLLMEGIDLPHCRGEEFDLESMGRDNAAAYRNLVTAFQRGKYDEAYAFLRSLPDSVQQTRICRHYLTCLDGACPEARKALVLAIRRGEHFDPLLELRIADAAGDAPAVLRALDAVLASRQNPPVYLSLKAGVLLSQGHAAEAYAIAQDTMALEPAVPLAYIVAIRASAPTHADEALRVVESWSRISAPEMIDQFLSSVPDLKAFCSSAPYVRWKHSAVPAATEPAPRG